MKESNEQAQPHLSDERGGREIGSIRLYQSTIML